MVGVPPEGATGTTAEGGAEGLRAGEVTTSIGLIRGRAGAGRLRRPIARSASRTPKANRRERDLAVPEYGEIGRAVATRRALLKVIFEASRAQATGHH